MRIVLALLFLCIPLYSQAAVLISEVAWMGSADSANHEWIELQNTGSSDADVSGWTLIDEMNLSIPLAGVIPAGNYAVLERTSDESASGQAFLIYTGALVNTGATLVLKRADGSIEDQVAGGENWQGIGGDNVTKETAQYTTAGWVTGTPTPGRENAGTAKPSDDTDDSNSNEEEEENEETTAPSTSAKKSNSSETVKLVLTDSILSLKVDGQKKGYVNQLIDFEVEPSGVGKTIESSLVYRWNFGDGAVAFGKESTHSYAYPGTYIVTVYGAFKRQEQVARYEVTILPVAISVTRNTRGDVQINNDSPYEIDVSGYVIRGEKGWKFPEYSIILPNQTVTLPKAKIGNGLVKVFDTEGELVTTSHTVAKEELAVEESEGSFSGMSYVSSEPLVLAPATLAERFGLVDTAEAAEPVLEDIPSSPAPILGTTSDKSASRVPDNAWPYLGLIAVILLGLIGTATKITRNQND